MKRAFKTLGIFLSAIFLLAACGSDNDEEDLVSTGPDLHINVSQVKDYRLLEEDLSKPPYSEGFTKDVIHQIPLAQLPDWVRYLAYTNNSTIIRRTLQNGDYIYNFKNMLSSNYGNFYDSNGYYLYDNQYFLSNSLDWELVCITKPEIIEDYDALKEMMHDQSNPLLGEWVVDFPSDGSRQQYWEFNSDGTGATYYKENGQMKDKLRVLYTTETVKLSSGREWIALKMAYAHENLTINVLYERKGDTFSSVLQFGYYNLKKVDEQ